MNKLSTAGKLDLKLAEINRRLRGFGVPFELIRLGNYRNGEWQIDDVIAHFSQKKYKIAVGFLVLTPYTGVPVEYWCQFNSTYSTEALSGQIVVPVVNENCFLMIKSYGTFIGQTPLLFPRGFIPESKTDLPAISVTKKLIERKFLQFVNSVGGTFVNEPQLLQNKKGKVRLAEDSSTSGNWLTVSTVKIKIDLLRYEKREKEFRSCKLIPLEEFYSYVGSGEILDLHSLSAFVVFTAVKNRSAGG
ncbi:MAG: hypothetical protein WCT18_00130 [Patescibacteria group bacterium]